MVIYRPHRGGLAESMSEKVEFETIVEMKEYISKKTLKYGEDLCFRSMIL